MRLTTRTNLATRVLMFCATNEDDLVRTSEIAERCNSSVNHVAHVVSDLKEGGFIETVRGRSGGLRLARPKEQVSIGAVFRVFEADIPFAECFDPKTNSCPLIGACRLSGFIGKAIEAFYGQLDTVTLKDLVEGNCGLDKLLRIPETLAAQCDAAAT